MAKMGGGSAMYVSAMRGMCCYLYMGEISSNVVGIAPATSSLSLYALRRKASLTMGSKEASLSRWHIPSPIPLLDIVRTTKAQVAGFSA